jgi:protein-tyrosine-phosphatase
MAEAVARQIAFDIIEPASAGLYPLGHLCPSTAKTLATNGYSVDGLASKRLSRTFIENTDLVVNISGQCLDEFLLDLCGCEGAALPQKIVTWNVEDPYGAHMATYQRILEELETRVLLLASRLRAGERAINS